MGRTLAVDLGTRRVGLALSDPSGMIASPLRTIPFQSFDSLVDRILSLCLEKGVERVVIGLPVREGGGEGEGCVRSRILSERLSLRGMTCVLWDESWSSRDAEEILRTAGRMSRAAREKKDAVAASLILREYLESSSPASSSEG